MGTRIAGLLTDELDIDRVLTGLQGRSFLRAGLASLGAREQVLLMGHALYPCL